MENYKIISYLLFLYLVMLTSLANEIIIQVIIFSLVVYIVVLPQVLGLLGMWKDEGKKKHNFQLYLIAKNAIDDVEIADVHSTDVDLDYMDKPEPTYERFYDVGVFENYACYHTLTNANFRNYSTSTEDKEFYFTLAKYASDHARKMYDSSFKGKPLPRIEAYFDTVPSFKSRTPVLNLEKMKLDFPIPIDSNSESTEGYGSTEEYGLRLQFMFSCLEHPELCNSYLQYYSEVLYDEIVFSKYGEHFSKGLFHTHSDLNEYFGSHVNYDQNRDRYMILTNHFSVGYLCAEYVEKSFDMEEFNIERIFNLEPVLRNNPYILSPRSLFYKVYLLLSFFVDNPANAPLFKDSSALKTSFINTPFHRCELTFIFYWFVNLRHTKAFFITPWFILGFREYFSQHTRGRLKFSQFLLELKDLKLVVDSEEKIASELSNSNSNSKNNESDSNSKSETPGADLDQDESNLDSESSENSSENSISSQPEDSSLTSKSLEEEENQAVDQNQNEDYPYEDEDDSDPDPYDSNSHLEEERMLEEEGNQAEEIISDYEDDSDPDEDEDHPYEDGDLDPYDSNSDLEKLENNESDSNSKSETPRADLDQDESNLNSESPENSPSPTRRNSESSENSSGNSIPSQPENSLDNSKSKDEKKSSKKRKGKRK